MNLYTSIKPPTKQRVTQN